jgi:late competence protein required for DNA uptake (superfamily II DNA/RNA helicase)
MQRQIAAELRNMHKPQVFKYRQEIGVHAVLGIGNTSRRIFAGIATTLEQGCIKLLLPHVKHARQSLFVFWKVNH